MGLNFKPEYRLIANSNDITQIISERLVTLRFTDEAGFQSDILEITLADNDQVKPIAVPPTGAELTLYLGYNGSSQKIGMFVCDELEISGYPSELVIRARSAQFDDSKNGKSNMQTQKTRAWAKDTKFGDVVKKIASEHGMKSVVSSVLTSILLPHTAQTDESDIHFLQRMARKFDAVAKAADGKIIVAKKGEGTTASGGNMPTVRLQPIDVIQFRMVKSKRETAGEVVAYYHAIKEAKRHEVRVGNGEPRHQLKMQYPTQAMALAAARSELDKRSRAKTTLSVTLPGRPDLVAEGRVVMSGFRPGVNGTWSITRAEHMLNNSGYVTTVEAEIPQDDGTSPSVNDVTD